MSEIESTLEEQGPVSCRIRVQVPGERVQAAIEAAYKALAKSAKVSGFRKGKVPRSVLEQNFGDKVHGDVVGDLIEEAGEAEAPQGATVKAEEAPVYDAPCGKPYPAGKKYLHLHTRHCRNEVCEEIEAARQAAREE